MIKAIPDYEGYYASEDGKILSDRVKGSARKRGPLHELAYNHNKYGYALVKIRNSKTGKRDDLLVHRLVAQAFIPNPNNLPDINHKHGIKDDNRASELEWCTKAENTRHAIETGLYKPRGEDNGQAKLTWAQIQEIRDTYKPWDREFGGQALAKKYGVGDSTIDTIVRGLSWQNSEYDYKPSRRKLSKEQADEIKNSYVPKDPNFGGRALAEKYGVTPGTITHILKGLYDKCTTEK